MQASNNLTNLLNLTEMEGSAFCTTRFRKIAIICMLITCVFPNMLQRLRIYSIDLVSLFQQ